MSREATQFKKGHKKIANSGRKKGDKDKITLNLINTLIAMGHDAAAEQVKIYVEAMKVFKKKTHPNSKSDFGAATYLSIAEKANSELMKYTYPARKAIEGADGKELTFKTLVEILTDGDDDEDDDGSHDPNHK